MMESQHTRANMAADVDSIRKQLEIEWQDHFHTRTQSWKVLQMILFLLLGFVGADIQLKNIWLTTVLGVFVLFSAVTGFMVAISHWRVQIRIFRDLNRLESALGLHAPELLGEGHKPASFRWIDIINPLYTYVPVFIIRMQLVVILFTIVYVAARHILGFT